MFAVRYSRASEEYPFEGLSRYCWHAMEHTGYLWRGYRRSRADANTEPVLSNVDWSGV